MLYLSNLTKISSSVSSKENIMMITTMAITICNIFSIENNNKKIPPHEESNPMMIIHKLSMPTHVSNHVLMLAGKLTLLKSIHNTRLHDKKCVQ
jgi:hypothetical protein